LTGAKVIVLGTKSKSGTEPCHKLVASHSRLRPWAINAKVFEDKAPLAAVKRSTAPDAGYFAVYASRVGFDAHKLVGRAALRTAELGHGRGGCHGRAYIASGRQKGPLRKSKVATHFDPIGKGQHPPSDRNGKGTDNIFERLATSEKGQKRDFATFFACPISLIGRSGSSAFRLSTTAVVNVARGLVLLYGIGA
jgi:hypothetical protein